MTVSETTSSGRNRLARHWLGKVVARRDLGPKFVWIELEIEGFAGARPGQFVVVHCADRSDQVAGESWGSDKDWPTVNSAELKGKVALMRRPFSIADVPAGGGGSRLALQFEVLGAGTNWLAQKAKVGAELRLVGPLGNGFGLTGARRAVLAAGGMGTAPMLFLARELRKQGSAVTMLAGARNRELLPVSLTEGAVIDEEGEPSFCCEVFTELGVKVGIATDDGSAGRIGFLTDSLADYLSRHRELSESGSVVYTCGPEPMMGKVCEVASAWHLRCEVCMERYMACGLGACQSCVCKQKSESADDGWQYKLVCSDGPVFDGQNIMW